MCAHHLENTLENIDADIDYVLEFLPGIVDKLRRMSPLYNG